MSGSLPAGRSGEDNHNGGSSDGDEVAKKSCRQQGVLTVEVTSDNYTTTEKVIGGETRSSDGLSELITRQNRNLKNYDLFYDFDTMLNDQLSCKRLTPSLTSSPYSHVESQTNQTKSFMDFQINKWRINCKKMARTQDLLPNKALIPCLEKRNSLIFIKLTKVREQTNL